MEICLYACLLPQVRSVKPKSELDGTLSGDFPVS